MVNKKFRIKKHCPNRTLRSGFTLIELLTVISIIGVLSSIGSVSYQSARATGRDVKRTSDMKQLQTGLEIFNHNNEYYPGDGQFGRAGIILGQPNTSSLSDVGFASKTQGSIYMLRVSPNAEPEGLPYTYRSLDADGDDCNEKKCASYAIIFALEKTQPNSGLQPGPNAITPYGFASPERGAVKGVIYAGRVVGIESLQGSLAFYADQTTEVFTGMIEDKRVKDIAELGVAPIATAAAVANAAVAVNAAAGTATVGPYLLFFITQPMLLFRRRRRQFWGTVYNSLSRLPEDLVIVRLRDCVSGRVVRSAVTDKGGRYTFLVSQGRYWIEVAKGGFSFPSELTKGKKEDGPFLDVYHGEDIEVGSEGASLTPNIPIDPTRTEVSDNEVIRSDRWRKTQSNIALLSPVLGAISLVLKPTMLTALLFVMQILVYLFFKRIANPSQPKNWGKVYEDGTGKPVFRAVIRIFAMPYHKLLETQVTDHAGRYNFRVGSNKYYVTVTKKGYQKTTTDEVDFSEATKPMFVAADLPLRREGYIVATKKEKTVPVEPTTTSTEEPLVQDKGE